MTSYIESYMQCALAVCGGSVICAVPEEGVAEVLHIHAIHASVQIKHHAPCLATANADVEEDLFVVSDVRSISGGRLRRLSTLPQCHSKLAVLVVGSIRGCRC